MKYIFAVLLVFLVVSTVQAAPPTPPAGMQWVQTFDDEFNSLDTTKWNGSYAGTLWCGGEANVVPGGPGGCNQNYFGVSVSNGVLSLTGAPNQANFSNTANRAVINTSGKFAQRYGYFEFRAKMPHDVNGDGDGLWPALWGLPVGKSNQSQSGCGPAREESDFLEMDLSPTDMAVAHFTVHDQCIDEFSVSYPNASAGDLSANYHIYGLNWKNDGTPHGTMCINFDGVQQSCHTLTATDTLWDNGIYLLEQVIPCPPNNQSIFGGAPCTNNTSSNNPMLVDYTRVYQLSPISTSSFVALIGGAVVNSSYVIDGGFWSSFWGFPPDARVFQNNQPNTSQQYTFAPVSGGFSICDVANGSCLTDGADGLVQQGQGTDTWVLTQSGSQWIVQDARTSRYIGALPATAQANVQMSTAPVAIPLTLISGSFPSGGSASPDCTTVTTVGPAITDAAGNTWSLTAGGNVAENGVTDTSTFNVIKLVYSAGFIYQQNTAGNWYRRTATTGWMQVSAPACALTPSPGTLGFTSSSNNTVTGAVKIIFSMSAQAMQSKIYLDGTWVAVIPPAVWVWDTTKVANGSHVLRQDEFNSNGTLVNSESATVQVSN